jgi:tetratricopeptide (TPR) repeat protein
MTKDKVTLQTIPTPKEFPVNEIKYLQIPGEPRELMDARNASLDGHYQQTIDLLDKIPPPQLSSEAVKQDAEYYRILANAKLAAGGISDAKAAGTALVGFLKNNKDSYHFYEANQAAGDLLVAIGRNDQAASYYSELANAPFPEIKLRAAVSLGRALQSQGKHTDALKQFEAALKADAKGKIAESEVLPAQIGKAKSMSELGEGKEALALLNEVIDKLPAESNQLCAQAYNALGSVYLTLKQPKAARNAYLHVDVIYNQFPDQHAEALYHLKDLWTQFNKPERAKEAADTLKTRYASSQWNR